MVLALREAESSDAALLHEWRNDRVVRENSFDRNFVEPEIHRRWFAAKLAARDRTRIWILTDDGVPAGLVRYDRDEDAAQVSVSIAASFRGRGLGAEILRLSSARACEELGVRELRALIKPGNAASIAAFERAGFVREGTTSVADEEAVLFVWRVSFPPSPASPPSS